MRGPDHSAKSKAHGGAQEHAGTHSRACTDSGEQTSAPEPPAQGRSWGDVMLQPIARTHITAHLMCHSRRYRRLSSAADVAVRTPAPAPPRARAYRQGRGRSYCRSLHAPRAPMQHPARAREGPQRAPGAAAHLAGRPGTVAALWPRRPVEYIEEGDGARHGSLGVAPRRRPPDTS